MAGAADDQATHGVADKQEFAYLLRPCRRQAVEQRSQVAAIA